MNYIPDEESLKLDKVLIRNHRKVTKVEMLHWSCGMGGSNPSSGGWEWRPTYS